MQLGLGKSLSIRQSSQPFPTADLTFLWTGGYDGTSLLNTKGANPTYVSGTGLDAIYDFSVLSDIRLDKSNATYWGASLDAYFYYDAGNPYHYKLKDFSYHYFESQMASDNNYCFAKLVFESEVLQSVDFIGIYSVEQTDDNLTKLQSYIEISTYYGAALNLNPDFIDWTDPTHPTNWTISGAITGTNYIEQTETTKLKFVSDSAFLGVVQTIEKRKYKFIAKVDSILYNVIYLGSSSSSDGFTYISATGIISVDVNLTVGNQVTIKRVSGATTAIFDYVYALPYYENYYENEKATWIDELFENTDLNDLSFLL